VSSASVIRKEDSPRRVRQRIGSDSPFRKGQVREETRRQKSAAKVKEKHATPGIKAASGVRKRGGKDAAEKETGHNSTEDISNRLGTEKEKKESSGLT